MKNDKHYTMESCHSIGYGWNIYAPKEVRQDEIENIMTALVNYTDEPNTTILSEMLQDEFFCEDYDLASNKLELYKKITIYVESVHRDPFTQSLQEIK